MYEQVCSNGNKKHINKFISDVRLKHGVEVELLHKHDFFGLCMTRHYLDPFHAIATPGGNVFLLNLARLLHHRGSFKTFVTFLKSIKVPKGGGLWVRVRFGNNNRLQIVSDAGENWAFAITPPTSYMGPDHTSWCFSDLSKECHRLGIQTQSNDTQETLSEKLNKNLSTKQGWKSLDRMVMMRILQLWHWISRFVTYLPHEFAKFVKDIPHFEPALRVICDAVVCVFGPRSIKTQLLVMRDTMPSLAWHALSRGTTLAAYDMRPAEDCHREHKARANTKILRSNHGVAVKIKIKKEPGTDSVGDEGAGDKEDTTGENTPESTNAYHHRQLMETHHTLVMREKSKNKNMWKRRCARQEQIGIGKMSKRKLSTGMYVCEYVSM